MQAWHFSETAYPYLPPADEYESIRVTLPNRIYDPAKGAALYDRYHRRVAGRRGRGRGDHAQRASSDRDLRRSGRADRCWRALARLTKKARLLILGNPIANRREPVRVAEEMAMIDVLSHGRLEVRLRARRALRDPAGQQQPGAHERAPVGGASTSSSRPGPTTTGRSATRAGSSTTATSTSGRGRTSSRIRRSGSARRRRAAPRGSARMATSRRRSSPASTAPGRFTRPIARAGARPAAATTCRSTASPMRRWSMSRETESGPAPAPRSCCGTCPPTRCRRTSPIRRATCRSPANVQVLRGAAPTSVRAHAPRRTVDKAIEAGIMFAGTPDQVYQQIKSILRSSSAASAIS